MNKISSLEEFRKRHHITPSYAAFFIGVEINGYWDLEMHNNESWQLTVAEFLRACIFCGASPELLLPDDAFRSGSRTLVFPKDQYGQLNVAFILREMIENMADAADAIGWEEAAFKGWFADEATIGKMDLLALNYLCEYLNVDILSIIMAFWQGLGGREIILQRHDELSV